MDGQIKFAVAKDHRIDAQYTYIFFNFSAMIRYCYQLYSADLKLLIKYPRNTILIIANAIKIPTTEVSSPIPFNFNITSIPINAKAISKINTRAIGAKIKPNRSFLIKKIPVIIKPGKTKEMSIT